MPQTGHKEPLDAQALARWWSVDFLIVGYLAATVLVVVVFAEQIPGAGWVALGHAALLACYLGLKRAARRRPGLRLVYILSPLLLVLFVFQALGLILPHLRAETMDDALAWWDVRIFGSDPTRWFDLSPWTAGILQACYTSYYLVFLAVAWVLVARGRLRTLLTFSGVIVGCFFTTYVGYYLVPAYGPRVHFAYHEPLPLGPAAGGIHALLDKLEYIKLDAFPSGHTALSVLCVALLFSVRARIAWVLTPLVAGLIVSTVALRYHYAVDVVAGLLCVPLWFPCGLRALRRVDARD